MSVNYLECKKGNLIIRKRDQGSFIMEIIVPETYFKTQQGESIVIAIENKKEIIYSLGLIMPNFKTDAHFLLLRNLKPTKWTKMNRLNNRKSA